MYGPTQENNNLTRCSIRLSQFLPRCHKPSLLQLNLTISNNLHPQLQQLQPQPQLQTRPVSMPTPILHSSSRIFSSRPTLDPTLHHRMSMQHRPLLLINLPLDNFRHEIIAKMSILIFSAFFPPMLRTPPFP